MLEFATLPPKLATWTSDEKLSPLGPGTPDMGLRSELSELSIEACFEPYRVRDHEMAKCAMAGLWLFHDFLDESHRVSQEIHTVAGSYWHAIMHRREPDFWNSKYWFRKVANHAIFSPLCLFASEIAKPEVDSTLSFLQAQSHWDACAFVDLCEKHIHQSSPVEQICRRIAHKEWELLFQYCITHAIEG